MSSLDVDVNRNSLSYALTISYKNFFVCVNENSKRNILVKGIIIDLFSL